MGWRTSLDSALLALLREPAPEQPRASQPVSVTVKFSGPVAALEAVGFAAWTLIPHPANGPSIAAGPIPRHRLGELADLPGVLFVEADRPLRAELNNTVPEIQANVVHSGNPSRKGAGVVIGIIDSGIDFSHRSFRNDDGTTRVRGIWDQTVPPPLRAGERAPTAFPGRGVEYSDADINATLRMREDSVPLPAGTVEVRSVDRDGHGTHVAGIAAGDGSQNGNCRGSGVFVGVAPRAHLLIVKVPNIDDLGGSTSLLHAFSWIWNHPAVVGDPTAVPPVPRRPVVVNLSMGDNQGPHDGTSLVESGLDLFLLQNRGHAVVKSAGNEGGANRHAQVVVPPNLTADVKFTVGANDRANRHLEIWYSQGSALRLTLRAPVPAGGGVRRSSVPVGPSDDVQAFLANVAPPARQVTATITSRGQDPRNSAGVFEIDLTTPGPVPLLEGEWEIHLENVLGQPATADLYIDGRENAPKFTTHATRAGSLTTPGTAKLVATVGAYAQKSFLFFDWSGDLTTFSSFGPTRDGSPKPDVCAPGSKVTSVKTKTRQHCCCNCCFDFYTDTTEGGAEFQGTSMAAPHVTGTIALMFEKDATLHAQDILRILRDTARAPEVSHGALPDSQWGGGRVSALNAVNGVIGPVPIPPPPGPHHRTLPAGPVPLGGGISARARRGHPAPFIAVDVPLHSARGVIALEHARVAATGDRHAPAVTTLSSTAVLHTATGHCWAALISRHLSEVRGLINHNPRVATCWHRMGGPQLLDTLGPAFAGHGVLTLQDNADAFAAWRPRARRFLNALERLASPELAAAVRQQRELLGLDVEAVVHQSFHRPTG